MVYVSAYNIISSLGLTTRANIESIKSGMSGIKIVTDKKVSPTPVPAALVDTQKLDIEFSQISEIKNYTRFEKLAILSINYALKYTKIDITSNDTLIILSTTKGNIDLLDVNKYFENDRFHIWKSAEVIGKFFNNPNEVITVSNACISGSLAIGVAQRLINAGYYKNVVVAGADIISKFTMSGFQSFQAIGTDHCKPFDKERDGITLGEGAGTIILSSEIKYASEAKIIVSGASSSNDANHISGPSRTGSELAHAINTAMNEAEKSHSEISYISAHGTATIYNDEMESKAINIAGLQKVPLNSIKGYIGHTLGAAGIIESVAGICSITEDFLYGTYGFSKSGTEQKVNVIKALKKKKSNNFIKTASGFGGCNMSLLFEKLENDLQENKAPKKISDNLKITKEVAIYNKSVFIDKKEIYNSRSEPVFADFAKSVYRYFEIKYPKYYKMDNLSKLGFLASEILLKKTAVKDKYKDEEIAIILSNGSSSIDSDIKYQKTIRDKDRYFPSPSVFVYTLANVVIGEICIRHKIKGENTVFISKDFNIDFIREYVKILFETGKAKACIFGRLEYDISGNYEANLFLTEKN